MSKKFSNDLLTYIRAGYPIITILSSEEDRIIECIDEMIKRTKTDKKLFVWSVSRGFVDMNGKKIGKGETNAPEQALRFVSQYDGNALFLFKDLTPYLKDNAPNSAVVVRMIRDLVNELTTSKKTMVWISPVLFLPDELEKEVTVLDMPLPNEEEHFVLLNNLIERYKNNPKIMVDLDEDGKDKLVKACQGLTKCEAENALAKTIVNTGQLTSDDVKSILSEKEQIIRKSGILEFTASLDTFGNVGGLNNLKLWLKQRKNGFSQKARDFGLPYPRGVMLVGVPGCGKSLCAKAVASEWQMPLLKFDLGKVFGKEVGKSEENMRKALSVAENVAPAILWIDELEKGLSGMGSSGGDGGVATRVFGYLLTWMEEKEKPVFVVATGNNIDKLPPELLRKGRVDEVFFVDLPTPHERAEIIAIHIAKYGRDPSNFDIKKMALSTEGFSGAELEEVVRSALYEAFSDDDTSDLTTEHMLKIAQELIPLSRSRSRDIGILKNWADKNCRMAAKPYEEIQKEEKADSVIDRRARLIDY